MKKFGILFLLATILILGCVTTKKKSDISKFKRGYHSLTSHYNYWFNANEALRLKEAEMVKGYKDNYNKLLPLYPETAGEAVAAKKDFEAVEKKAAMGIGLHTAGAWTDDCYLLLAQAQFYKQDFETAETTLSFIKEEFNPNKTAKTKLKKTSSKKKTTAKKSSAKKKKEAKKKSAAKKKKAAQKKKAAKKKKSKSSGKDKKTASATDKKTGAAVADTKKEDPKKKDEDDEVKLEVTGKNPYKRDRRDAAYPASMIWYGRTLIEREKYEEAELIFRELNEDPFMPKNLQDDLSKAEAHLWIEQKFYDRAGVALTKAIKYSRKKKERARMAFIQAQLFEMAGETEQAYNALETVLKSKPEYALEFNARLHQILDGWYAGTITNSDAQNRLERMLKEGKNKEYLDQIYFTLGELALADKKKKEAIGYFAKSLAASSSNTAQRAESYLRLADLYYETEDFVLAKAYYDSTISVLPTTDERFARANMSAKNLTEIARLITTIENNDSIVRVFNMSEAERNDLAKRIKKDRDAAAAKQAAADQANKDANKEKGKSAPPPAANAGAKASTFYFYSDAAIKKGKRDFERSWGDRKLEDNWRRSQRLAGGANEDPGNANAADDPAKAQKTEEDALADIFKDLPRNQAELSVIHLATYEAMFKLGTLFRDKLDNNIRCSGTLEDMQARYPDTARFDKETWYYCFLAFNDLRNPTRAQYYLDLLVGKYPNSPYTKSITDPNFANASKEKERELNTYYEQTYNTFRKGDYKTALERCEEAPKKYGSTNIFTAKFALLSALCVGNLQGNEAYCKALSEVIARFPDSPESTRAKEIARLLACKGFEGNGEAKKADLDEAFVTENDKLHYFMVVLTGADIKLENVKNAISDYNRENHKNEQLRLSNIYLGTSQDQPIIVLRKFDNKDKAMKYLNEVKNKKDFLGESNKVTYEKEFFVVTQENYRRVLKNKTLEGYRTFFQSNYEK